MSDYEKTYHSQRLTVKRMADELGISTKSSLRMANGKTRQAAMPIEAVRIKLVEKLLGRYTQVTANSVSACDLMLNLSTLTYTGKLGPALQETQRLLREGQNLRAGATDLFDTGRNGSNAERWAVIERVHDALALARGYQDAADELQAMHMIDPVKASQYDEKITLRLDMTRANATAKDIAELTY